MAKVGRPPALKPDDHTLKTIRGLGQIQATTKECAAVLGVSEQTYIAFKKRHAPLIDDTYAKGSGQGLASLRRKQFAMAAKNATMAIWLGKQYLGQRDRQEIASTVSVEVTDARDRLADILSRQTIAEEASGDTGTTH